MTNENADHSTISGYRACLIPFARLVFIYIGILTAERTARMSGFSSLSGQEQNLLHFWSLEAFEALKSAADRQGVCLNFDLFDLRQLILARLGSFGCMYCKGPVGVESLQVDAKTPFWRGGKFVMKNLAVCCAGCKSAKDMLDDREFRELLALIQSWPTPVRENVLARLRAGASLARAALPRPGSLEWFTGGKRGESEDVLPDNGAAVGDTIDSRAGAARAEDAGDAPARAGGDSRRRTLPHGQPQPVPHADHGAYPEKAGH